MEGDFSNRIKMDYTNNRDENFQYNQLNNRPYFSKSITIRIQKWGIFAFIREGHKKL